MNKITNLNQYIDHTLLKADATENQIKQLIKEAKEYNFKSVCINPYYVKLAAQELKNSAVKVCTVIGFPLGANTKEIKVAETKQAILDGATEIDMVINIGALKDKKDQIVLSEIQAIRKECHKDIVLKVIIECSLLTEEEKILACKLVSTAKADFIKTSTGFANGGATIDDIKLMKANISSTVAIKASGGVKTQEQALAMINAGASRIGTSNGVTIVTNQAAKNNY